MAGPAGYPPRSSLPSPRPEVAIVGQRRRANRSLNARRHKAEQRLVETTLELSRWLYVWIDNFEADKLMFHGTQACILYIVESTTTTEMFRVRT